MLSLAACEVEFGSSDIPPMSSGGFAGGFPVSPPGISMPPPGTPGVPIPPDFALPQPDQQPALEPRWRPPFYGQFLGPSSSPWVEQPQVLCPGLANGGVDVVVDERGLFVLASGNDLGTGLGWDHLDDADAGVPSALPQPGEPWTRVFLDTGDGLEPAFELPGASITDRLVPQPDGGLLVWRDASSMQATCTPATPAATTGFLCVGQQPIELVASAASAGTAYLLLGDRRLLVHDGDGFVAHPTALPALGSALWTDGERVVVGGANGQLMELDGDAWTVRSSGASGWLTAVFGDASGALWIGTSEGELLREDADGFAQVAALGGPSCNRHHAIFGIVGNPDAVYAHTATALVRVAGDEVEPLGNWTCSPLRNDQRISRIVADGGDALFVAIADPGADSVCGSAFVVRFDGEHFDRL